MPYTECVHFINGNNGAARHPIWYTGETLGIDEVVGFCQFTNNIPFILGPDATRGDCVSFIHLLNPPGVDWDGPNTDNVGRP